MIRSIRRCIYTAFAAFLLLAGTSTPAQIRIGQTTGLTGAVAASVNEINIGAKLYLDYVNANGGISGQRIELVSLDDQFKVPEAVENAKKLIADPKVVALFLNRGTPHAQALMPLLERGQIPLVAPSTGAIALHNPVHPWIFNVRATYQLETERLTRHLATSGLERVAVLYVDDSFGKDAALGALKVFKEAGKTPSVYIGINRDKPDYTSAIEQIKAADSFGVVIVGSVQSVSDGIKALRASGYKAQVGTLSNNAASGFVKALGKDAYGVIVSQVFPSERQLATSMIAEASRLAAAQKIPLLTPAMIEGFAASKVLVLGLKRAVAAEKGGVVTRAGLKKALESMNQVDIGGLLLSYSPTDHTGLEFSDLSIIGPDGAFRR